MVWHFLTARSQARQREWERERARSNIENFEQYQSASAQWFFLVCRRWGRMFVRMIFAPGYVDWGWIFSETSWRVQCGSLAFWSAWSAWRSGAGLYGMKHNGHVTCHMCLFWYQPLKFGKHAFECMLDLHVLFVSGKAGGFRNVGTIQPSRVVTGNCTTFFTCTANVLKPPVRYYRPGEKIYGNTRGQLLHCQWKGHNACLPDCVRNGLGVGKVPE